MTFSEFHPTGATGDGDKEDLFYRSSVTGLQGSHYDLFKETHHRREDVDRAKRYIRCNFDPVSIHVINETK